LLDGMARVGRGDVHYLLDERDALAAAERFYERVRSPVLTDVKLDFGALPVSEVYPPSPPDLFSAMPLVIQGQYRAAARGVITLTGRTGAGAFERKIAVAWPDAEPNNDVLAPLWARAKVGDLMTQDLLGIQFGQPQPDVRRSILDLGLRYHLLTSFTSFVAVEERQVVEGGQPKTVVVPVEMPEGVSYEGVFGDSRALPGGGFGGPGFGGRGSGIRQALASSYGGTKQSERTVAAALHWLAGHQQQDGHWCFSAPTGSNKGLAFPNPGAWRSDCAATALALLTFLGSGQTHQSSGPYQKTVAAALGWLLKQQRADGDLAADTADKKHVAHALGALTLCETYAMTADKNVGRAAQKAIEFLAAQQDAKTGGWADGPGRSPTLSATVWHILALQSAKGGGLNVAEATWEKASRFLAAMEAENGAAYGETNPTETSPAATAAGLLCRMYLAGQGGPAVGLNQASPSPKDGVFNFHATLYLHRQSGPAWDAWNRAQRRQLVDAQVKDGAEAGSWWNPDDVCTADGGRLFQTAVNTLSLEVYYRYLPVCR
jgi:hypothetical protein